MPLNVPNLLTWIRIMMIPLVVGVFYIPEIWLSSWHRNLIATALFGAAAATDWLDGYLARRLNQMSAFGAFLDPVADKLMIAAALIVLVELERVNAIIAVVIIGREIVVSALREWMAKIGQSKSVAVNFLGKIKTISQMIADRAGLNFSLLVLDEVFGSLDETRRQQVVDLLRRLHDRFEQVIVITHVESVRDGLDRVMTVEYDEDTGASRVRVTDEDLDLTSLAGAVPAGVGE